MLLEEFFRGRKHSLMGTDRLKEAMKSSGIKKDYPSVTVVGTNGKGSVSHTIADVLTVNRLKVGMFTSPHLLNVSERIVVDGEKVDRAVLDETFKGLLPAVTRHNLTYFETLFLIALAVFKDTGVDVAVFEAGMGGRLDACNATRHDVVAVTRIALDHTQYLGKTVKAIAEEKLAVAHEGAWVVVSENQRVVFEVAHATGAKVLMFGRDFTAECVNVSFEGTDFLYDGRMVKTKLIGRHQAVNTATALTAAKVMLEEVFRLPCTVPGLLKPALKGRFEVLRRTPAVVFDVAHNPNALNAVFETARTLGIKASVVFSCMKDKDIVGNLEEVVSYLRFSGHKLFLTEIPSSRGASLKTLMAVSQRLGVKPSVVDRIKVEELRSSTIVTGSFQLCQLIEGYGEGRWLES